MDTVARRLIIALIACLGWMPGCVDAPSDNADSSHAADDEDASYEPVDPCRGPSTTVLSNASVRGGLTLEANRCYYVEGLVIVRDGSLAIEEGVELSFLDDRDGAAGRLIISESASLRASGTEANPVVIHTRSHRRGQSRGVRIAPGSQGNRLDHVVFEHHGKDTSHVALDIAGQASITSSTFRENDGYALAVRPSANLVAFANNTIRENERAIALSPEHVPALDATTVIEQNSQDYVEVTYTADASVDSAQSWSPLGAPFLISGTLRITAHLRIEPDTRVEFLRDAGLLVEDTGALTLDGTEAQRVIMLPRDPDDEWRGIGFNSDSALNTIRHASIGGAGSLDWTGDEDSAAAIFVGEEFIERGSVVFEGANIFDSAADGIQVSEGELRGCDTLTFGDVRGEPVRLSGTSAMSDCAPQN